MAFRERTDVMRDLSDRVDFEREDIKMFFDRNENREVIALLGAGSMGTNIARRFAAGRVILLGDINEENLEKVSRELTYGGYAAEIMVVNALDRESVRAFARTAASLGPVKYFIDTAGASPNQSDPEHILNLDMVGTGYALDAFGEVMAPGGAGLVISSQTGYMLRIPDEVEQQILSASTGELMDIPYIREVAMQNSGLAYMIAKRVNHLQAQKAAATTWKARRARINTLSPGVIVTPLAYDEFAAAGEGYQKMIDASAAMRTGSSDEIAEAAAFLLGEHAGFINGTDLLIDGGTIAAIRTGEYVLGS